MKTYSFRLRLDGVPLDHDGFVDFSNAVFHSDVDCTPGVVAGVPEVTFDWEAEDLRAAVAAAIHHIRTAAPAVRVVGVETYGDATLDEAFAA